jgi:dihydropyrimidine dehydrogenase (NAD+) subunit PreA
MTDLAVTIAGMRSPNPFWLASAPPTNTGEQIERAFDLGWGGAVWKTLGHQTDEIVNVSSRLAAIRNAAGRIIGINNIELISDRPLAENLAEITRVKQRYPRHLVIASIMTGERKQWEELIRQCEDAGADGFELNFGCPHGMCERGMGSAVGQDITAIQTITGWAKAVARRPVLVKLTPNITDILEPARAAAGAGADGLALINTIKSLMGVDLDHFSPYPIVGGRSSHGGYAGNAVKPVALQMVASIARDSQVTIPISGIGGINDWRDCAEFMVLGATTVQVCTGVMFGGYRIVRDMIDGLGDWMAEKGFASCDEFIGKAIPNFVEWNDLDLSYKVIARIDAEKCIGCQLCYPACRDGGHQAIRLPEQDGPRRSVRLEGVAHRRPTVDEEACVGCNLCSLVCPVPGCITMAEVESGRAPETWRTHCPRP